MKEFEQLLGLFVAAVVLAAAARRVGAPYPVFLALGGALLAFLPGAPSFTVPPELALALFVAPVLLDAAYDASLRDLGTTGRRSPGWSSSRSGSPPPPSPSSRARSFPAMPWAPAIALGAVVAPPDAVAATAVLRPLRPPHRILTILEGESLLNDASALLIYRLAVGAVAANGFSDRRRRPDVPARGGRQRRRRPGARVAHAAADGSRAARADGDHPAVRHARSACGCSPSTSGCRAC